jgi:tetratricopeptide (TPR) repeat protein
VQLIRATDGFHVWSEIYDRTINDIFAIQDEIAIKVGGALSASILSPGGGGKVASISTDDLDAYDLYLQARRERATFSFGGLLAAEELLKGALRIDPDFLEAKNELAGNYVDQSHTGLMNESDAFATALAITDQVLAVRPADAASRAIQLFIKLATFSGADGKETVFESLRELENIVAEHPTEYQARVFLTQLLHGLQQDDKALQLQLDALERDPYNPRIHFEIGTLYLEMDQLDDARDALNKSIEIEPDQPNAYLRLAMVALRAGDGVDSLHQNLKSLGVDPRDHEIPGFIAAFLYQLGLISEGDDFQRRVNAIAPTSEVAYRIELLRAINTDDEEASIASARRAIEDNINDRHFAYVGAVQYLLRSAVRSGTVAEESAYLEENAPGILDMDADSIPNKYRNAQRIAFDAWYTTLSREELMRRLDKILEFAANLGIDLREVPEAHVGILALQGDIDQAIDIALAEIFSEPVTMHPDWRDRFAQAQYSEFVKDPRIVDAMQNWEDEENALRDRVQNYLLDLSTSAG